jgi:hypothetical protein
MVAGVDPTGQTEEQSAHETTNSVVEISKARVLMLLIVLAVNTIRHVLVNVVALHVQIVSWLQKRSG